MAAAAAVEISFGVPVNLEFGQASIDAGAEDRGGQRVVVLVLDGAGFDEDGRGYAHVALTPEEASALSDVLAGLARVGG